MSDNLEKREILNHFLVKVFNEILKSEEKAIGRIGSPPVSVREMHVIECVCNLQDGDNRAASIAAHLHITAGTLTASVSLLEKKGYVQRIRDTKDRRVVHICPTEKGISANRLHQAFHKRMIDHVLTALEHDDQDAFLLGLQHISAFFDAQYQAGVSKKKG